MVWRATDWRAGRRLAAFLARCNPDGRYTMFVAAAASLTIHAIVLAAAFGLTRHPHLVPPVDLTYIYVLPASAGRGAGASAATHLAKSAPLRHPQSSNSLPEALHPHRAPRLTKHLARRARAAVLVAKAPKPAVASPPSGVAADAVGPGVPRIASKEGDNPSEPQAAGIGGDSSSGALSGALAYRAPLVLSTVIPSYPETARRRGIEGQVVLQIVVDQFGRVEQNVEIMESLPMLDRAAIDAIRQWRFSPARDREGNPIRVKVRVPMRFTLQ